jgi:hypothetical protein
MTKKKTVQPGVGTHQDTSARCWNTSGYFSQVLEHIKMLQPGVGTRQDTSVRCWNTSRRQKTSYEDAKTRVALNLTHASLILKDVKMFPLVSNMS